MTINLVDTCIKKFNLRVWNYFSKHSHRKVHL